MTETSSVDLVEEGLKKTSIDDTTTKSFSTIPSLSSTIKADIQQTEPANNANQSTSAIRSNETRDDPRNLYVDNLPSLSDVELRNLFLPYGAILKSRVVIDPITRACAGYGFVMFEKSEDAAKAIAGLNQHTLGTKKLRVTIKRNKDRINSSPDNNNHSTNDKSDHIKSSNQSSPRTSPDSASRPLLNSQSSHVDTKSSPGSSNTNLYITGIPLTWMKSDVDTLFQTFGPVVDSRVLIDRSTGRNRGKAMVRLNTFDECDAAIKALHQRFIPPHLSQPVSVQHASSKDLSQSIKAHKISPPKPSVNSSSSDSSASHQSSQSGSGVYSQPRTSACDSGSPSSHRSSSPSSYHSHPGPRYAYPPAIEMNGAGHHTHSPVKMKHTISNPEYSAIGMTAFHTAPLPHSAYGPPLVASTPPYLMSPHQPGSVYIPSPSSAAYHPAMMHPSYLDQQQFPQHPHPSQAPHHNSHSASPANTGRFHPNMNGRTENHADPFHVKSLIDSRPTTSLYVYGLPGAITEADLERLFGIYGGVSSVRLMKHENGAPRGFAFVNMNSVAEAENAIRFLHKFQLGGRVLAVQFKTMQSRKQHLREIADVQTSENGIQ